MENLNKLITKYNKLAILYRVSFVLTITGAVLLVPSLICTFIDKNLFVLFSLTPIFLALLIAEIPTYTAHKITDEILKIFKYRLKWGINNDILYQTLVITIERTNNNTYTLIITCNRFNIREICEIAEEVIKDLNQELPPKFQLTPQFKCHL